MALHRSSTPYRRLLRLAALSLAVAVLLLAGQMQLEPARVWAVTEETSVQRVGIKIEYPVPNGPLNVAWESPGRSWFTSPSEDMVGVVTRLSNVDEELISVRIDWIALDPGSQPYDIAVGGDSVWFTLLGSNQLARVDLPSLSTTAVFSPTAYYSMPTANSGPSGIAVAPDGMVWIVSANIPYLTRFDPASESFDQWSYANRLPAGDSVSTARTYPDVATNHGNQIWLSVPGSDRMLGYDVTDNTFSSHPVYHPLFPASEPAGIAVDDRPGGSWDGGRPWITAYDNGVVGRYAPGTLAGWEWFRTSAEDSGPRGIATRDSGDYFEVWYTEENSGRVGRLVLTPDYDMLASFSIPQPQSSSPAGITTGADDTVWFAESGRARVSEIKPPYVSVTQIPIVFAGSP